MKRKTLHHRNVFRHKQRHAQRGSALLFTLYFSALFFVMLGATLSYIMVQHGAVQQAVWKTQALYTAEAGVQYYRWHLAHDPTNYTENTGVQQYSDPHGGNFGTYDLTVTPPAVGSTATEITSVAYSKESTPTQARVRVVYGKPSLGRYAFLTNSNVWFGDSETISGPLHTNSGARMDGTGDSLFTSSLAAYNCGPEHGCSGNSQKDAIWGTGYDPSLWQFPHDGIDFNAIQLNLDSLKSHANDSGMYLPDSSGYGYYIHFNSTGTVSIYTVTSLYSSSNSANGTNVTYDKKTWTALSGYQNVPLPANGIIFAEDDIWVDGQLDGRVTVVAARLPAGSYPPANAYIQDDINYVARDGTNALGIIGQQHVLVTLRSDNNLVIDAALMAIGGHVFRNYYTPSNNEPYKTYSLRDTITTYGSIVTNTTWTWNWVQVDNGPVISGYRNTVTIYDPDLAYNPPPGFPTSDEYQFISWEELELNEP